MNLQILRPDLSDSVRTEINSSIKRAWLIERRVHGTGGTIAMDNLWIGRASVPGQKPTGLIGTWSVYYYRVSHLINAEIRPQVPTWNYNWPLSLFDHGALSFRALLFPCFIVPQQPPVDSDKWPFIKYLLVSSKNKSYWMSLAGTSRNQGTNSPDNIYIPSYTESLPQQTASRRRFYN